VPYLAALADLAEPAKPVAFTSGGLVAFVVLPRTLVAFVVLPRTRGNRLAW
jgi:hypothetical protein